MIAAHTRDGHWRGRTLALNAAARVRTTPDAVAVIDDALRLTFAEVWSRAARLATSLERRGLQAGDVISFQLPNWHEAVLINLAAAMKGYVCNPIVPIYRDGEVEFILRDARTKLFIVPSTFRNFDYAAMAERLRPRLPDLRHVIVARGECGAPDGLDALIEDASTAAKPALVDANEIKLLLYTSGTTGAPKGVLHSSNTLGAELDAVVDTWAIRTTDIVLMPSPVTHITGYLYGLELPFAAGCAVLLMDRWTADAAVSLVAAHRATLTIGATPFLTELVEAAGRQGVTLPSMRLFGCGGSPVPPSVVVQARASLPNCATFRIYGSSEAPTVTLGLRRDDPPELGATTDGRIVNHEVMIVDPVSGTPMAPGAEGEIITRGPEVMLGYTSWDETCAAFDSNGFFHTGDLGFLSHGEFLTISGRKKDLIIRGGENISAKEIEDILHRHPAILEVAIVAAPHPRLGETPAAFVVLRDDMTIDLATLTGYLDEARLARQKFPEALYVVESLPRTASGKVQKHVLRDRCR
jgi:acyl-CoA synthetase (AMP-forming)/AMP-acid ligase II